MYQYKELGLVNTKEMLQRAYEQNYAVPAFNFVSIEQYSAIIDAVMETRSPVILLASPNLHRQLGEEILARVVQAGTDRIKHAGMNIPVALHLDHGMTYEDCVKAVENGFSSVMIDGSALPFEENIALTRKTADYANRYGVTVEAELGVLSGVEEEGTDGHKENLYTDAAMAKEFIKRSGADSLAISIGTCHGLIKLKPNPDGSLPELRYDILSDIEKQSPGFPIVLHGASTIEENFVKMINENGGHINQTVGIPEAQIEKAVKMAVCKVNVATDGWICALAHTRRILKEHPEAIDCRVFTLPIREELKKLYVHKIAVMGSANKA